MVCGGLKWWIDLGEWRARRIMRGMNPDVRPGGREEPASIWRVQARQIKVAGLSRPFHRAVGAG